MILAKVHKGGERIILSVCDKSILGKTFKEGNLQLDVAEDFYKGKETSEEEFRKLVRVSDIINLAGEESVRLGLSNNLVSKEYVLYIEGIPHAQVVLVKG